MNVHQFSHIVLAGDFNVNMQNSLHHKFCSLMDHFTLVTDVTYINPNGNSSLIDLVLSSSPQILNCTTAPPLANWDHNDLHFTISWKSGLHHSHCYRQVVWHCNLGDFAKAAGMFSETHWNALASEDIDQHCSQSQNTYLSVMEQCIPKKVLPPRRCNRPWLTKSLI